MGDGEPQEPADIATLLVRMATQRDKEAFAAVFRCCAPKIMNYMVARANGILPLSVLEEVCQEVFVAAWHDCASFDPIRDDPIVWIFAIARSYAIRELHDQMQRSDVVGVLWPSLPSRDAKYASLDDGIDTNTRRQRLRAALDSLPPEDVELIRDIYLYGKTHTQIASDRRLPLGTIKTRIRRSLEAMRKNMARGAK